MTPRILSVATAVPPYEVDQGEVKELVGKLWSGADTRRYVSVFRNSGISRRYFCRPLSYYADDHSFGERNDAYIEHALHLSEKAARRALDRAGVAPTDVGAIFFVSTTGVATPSLENYLILNMGLPEHIDQFAHFGHGCAAGAGFLGKAASWATLEPGRPVLLIATELSSLTFLRNDASRANIVSASLFADGSAAVVLQAGASEGPQIVGRDSVLWPDTRDAMGWRITEAGFGILLSKSVPDIVKARFRDSVERACDRAGVRFAEIKHFLAHPGGAKVLDALESVLGLDAGSLAYSRDVMREYGNMSSVTVLTILERFLQSGDYRPGDLGLVCAMGPGFRAEHVFFRC